MKKIRAAVIGCGNISVMHLDSIAQLEESVLVAVCDIRSERAESTALKYDTKAYTDYKLMIEKEEIDVIHICLPHYLHAEVAEYAISKGINVLTEKPMSIKYEDAVSVVELAEKNSVKYGVIFQCRYNTPPALVKRRIEEGKLGNVKCGRVVLTWNRSDSYYHNSDWKGTWEKEGGGVIINQAIHSLDLANWMIDSKPVDIQSSLHNRNHPTIEVEDTAEGFIKYENGATLSFFASNNYGVDEPIEIRLVCENGNAVLSYDEATIKYNDRTYECAKNDQQEMVSYSGGKTYWGETHIVQIRQFYRSVLGLEDLQISGREALKTHKIICDIYSQR